MSKRIQVSLSDEFHEWMSGEADKLGIATATMATILLTEAKKTRDNAANLQAIFDRMKAIDPETFAKVVAADATQLNMAVMQAEEL